MIDSRGVDWSRLARGVSQVRQHYRYSYTDAVWDLKQRLVMIPPDRHQDQRLLDHRLDVRGSVGDPVVTWEYDEFGNRIARALVPRVPREISFEVQYRVERRADARGQTQLARSTVDSNLEVYLQPTPLTAPDNHLKEAARSLRGGDSDPRSLVERVHDWAASAISYQLGITGFQTPAAMALHLGRGVCQDYAHLMLTVLRLLGIPARYVSGHLLGEGAPHAWVEVLLDDRSGSGALEVLAYDPTHHRRAGLSYVTVAVGRDFADVTPTSGSFRGSATGTLHWTKQAELVEIECVQGGTSTSTSPESAA